MQDCSWRVCLHKTMPIILSVNLFLGYLADSPFLDDLDHIIRCFDKTTKLRFRKAEEPQYIKFGSTRDNDDSYNIRFGQLKLMGSVLLLIRFEYPRVNFFFRSDVSQFFQPSVDCIIRAVLDQRNIAHKPISVSVARCSPQNNFPTSCEFSMSCLWAGSQRVTGYLPRYMKRLLPLG